MTSSEDRDHISRGEIAKDAVQDALGAGIHTVGEITTIITRAVGDVARAAGNLGTELFEIRDAARRANREHGHDDSVDDTVDETVDGTVGDAADDPVDDTADETVDGGDDDADGGAGT
jgi:hypothetical protein